MLVHLKKFFQLPWRDKVVLLQAAVLLVLLRVLLAVLPFARVQRMMGRSASTISRSYAPTLQTPTAENAPVAASRIGYLVAAAANHIPGTTCLPRALTTQILLRRKGHAGELHIGVNKDGSGSFEAHAWVEAQGTVVIGASETRYKSILRTA